MNNNIEVKYTVANNSVHVIEPKTATIGSTGYDFVCSRGKDVIAKVCYTSYNGHRNGDSVWLFWQNLSQIRPSIKIFC